MNKRIISLILALAAVCGGASAQPKVSGASPVCEKRGYDQRIVIDTAHVRVLYALNAKDIKDEDTYIDLGKLEVGNRVRKYSSEFLNLSDQEVLKVPEPFRPGSPQMEKGERLERTSAKRLQDGRSERTLRQLE